jgi:hypothetical protein
MRKVASLLSDSVFRGEAMRTRSYQCVKTAAVVAAIAVSLSSGSLVASAANSVSLMGESAIGNRIIDENLAYQVGVIEAAITVCGGYPLPQGWQGLHDNNIKLVLIDTRLKLSFERGRDFIVSSASFNAGACEALMVGE